MVNELMLVLRQAMCSVHQFGDFTRRRRSELLTLRSHFTHLVVAWCGAVPTVAFTHRVPYSTSTTCVDNDKQSKPLATACTATRRQKLVVCMHILRMHGLMAANMYGFFWLLLPAGVAVSRNQPKPWGCYVQLSC